MSKKLFDTVIHHMGRSYRYCSEKKCLQWVSYIDSRYNTRLGRFEIIQVKTPIVVANRSITEDEAQHRLMESIGEWNDVLERNLYYARNALK